MPNPVRRPKAQPAKRVTRETPSIQSLDRGLLILETVARANVPVSLGELTEVLGIDRSSVFRLANTLKRRGFLANPSTGKEYILGTSIWRIGHKYDWSRMLATVAHEHLNSLAREINETAHLAIREGSRALFVDHSGTSHVIAISGQTGEFIPLHCTSHGKALLVDYNEDKLRNLLGNGPLPRMTRQTIVSIDDLADHCRQTKRRGYVTDEEEFVEGVRCVAAPIRDQEGTVVASIGISAPVARFPRKLDQEYGARVLEIARQVSELLGASPRSTGSA
jgi:IclR family acetate operon transcriptional repressor